MLSTTKLIIRGGGVALHNSCTKQSRQAGIPLGT